MSNIINKATKLFERIKPIIMSEETSTTDTANNTMIEVEATQPKTTPLNMISAIINGAGVGLLLGILLGLAISPVVSGVIGTLSGLLAVLLGINEKYITPLKSVRIGAFGFFCVAGILYGMYVRTNKGLLPSREKMMEDYTKIGFTKQEARDFIAWREFKLKPASWSGSASTDQETASDDVAVENDTPANNSEEPTSNAETATTNTNKNKIAAVPAAKEKETGSRYRLSSNVTGAEMENVLYSSEIDGAQCYILNETDAGMDVKLIKNNFEKARGTWKELADDLETNLPEAVYIKVLFDMRDVFCAAGNGGKVKIPKSAAVNKINSGQSLSNIKKTLSGAGKIWSTIVTQINSNIPEENQKTVFLSLVKIFTHD